MESNPIHKKFFNTKTCWDFVKRRAKKLLKARGLSLSLPGARNCVSPSSQTPGEGSQPLMNLDQLFLREGADKSSAGHGYVKTYEELFAPIREKVSCLLEIGIYQGASIRAWLEYFPNALIIGIDCEPQYLHGSDRYWWFKGRQEDPFFLGDVLGKIPQPEIIIDDGSHMPAHQIASFTRLWPALAPGGLYAIEDCQAWYDRDQDPAYKDGAEEFLWTLASRVNWQGQDYIGRPGGKALIAHGDPAFEWVRISKGLLIIKKAP